MVFYWSHEFIYGHFRSQHTYVVVEISSVANESCDSLPNEELSHFNDQNNYSDFFSQIIYWYREITPGCRMSMTCAHFQCAQVHIRHICNLVDEPEIDYFRIGYAFSSIYV